MFTPRTSTLTDSQHAKLEVLADERPEPRVVGLIKTISGEIPIIRRGKEGVLWTLGRRGALNPYREPSSPGSTVVLAA